jgi:hypothetical protein
MIDALDDYDEENIIEVDQDDWNLIESPEKISTRGIGPCAGVIIHNPELKRVAMGHFVSPDSRIFLDFLESTRKRLGDFLQREVYLSGISPMGNSKEELKEFQRVRNHLVNIFELEGYSKSQVEIDWNDNDNISCDLYADPQKGKITIFKKDFSSLMDLK